MIKAHVSRSNEILMEIDLEYIRNLWESQKGICPYTGWSLILGRQPTGTTTPPNRASIDRIDPKLGYIQGNVEWVSLMWNYAKHQWAAEQVIAFAESITKS